MPSMIARNLTRFVSVMVAGTCILAAGPCWSHQQICTGANSGLTYSFTAEVVGGDQTVVTPGMLYHQCYHTATLGLNQGESYGSMEFTIRALEDGFEDVIDYMYLGVDEETPDRSEGVYSADGTHTWAFGGVGTAYHSWEAQTFLNSWEIADDTHTITVIGGP